METGLTGIALSQLSGASEAQGTTLGTGIDPR